MGRARLDGDVPLSCIRPSVRTLESGSPSRVDISLRSRRSSVAGRTARILADVIPPKAVDRGPTTDVNRGAQGKLDINCGWNGQRLRKSTSGVINYGRWRREGRRISTSAVEGTVNRLIGRRLGKGQHMCWTKRGAHLLLQVRCAVLNREFLQRYQRWFPAVGTRSIGLPWDWLPHSI